MTFSKKKKQLTLPSGAGVTGGAVDTTWDKFANNKISSIEGKLKQLKSVAFTATAPAKVSASAEKPKNINYQEALLQLSESVAKNEQNPRFFAKNAAVYDNFRKVCISVYQEAGINLTFSDNPPKFFIQKISEWVANTDNKNNPSYNAIKEKLGQLTEMLVPFDGRESQGPIFTTENVKAAGTAMLNVAIGLVNAARGVTDQTPTTDSIQPNAPAKKDEILTFIGHLDKLRKEIVVGEDDTFSDNSYSFYYEKQEDEQQSDYYDNQSKYGSNIESGDGDKTVESLEARLKALKDDDDEQEETVPLEVAGANQEDLLERLAALKGDGTKPGTLPPRETHLPTPSAASITAMHKGAASSSGSLASAVPVTFSVTSAATPAPTGASLLEQIKAKFDASPMQYASLNGTKDKLTISNKSTGKTTAELTEFQPNTLNIKITDVKNAAGQQEIYDKVKEVMTGALTFTINAPDKAKAEEAMIAIKAKFGDKVAIEFQPPGETKPVILQKAAQTTESSKTEHHTSLENNQPSSSDIELVAATKPCI